MDSARLNLDEVSASEHRGNEFNGNDSESKKDDDTGESVSASSKSGRSKFLKETSQSTMHGLNKFTSQIKKPSHRKVSPINWFPRKKVDSYLKRKIKMLQEVDGLNLSLDETLGDSNPHYSRVLKEKMAAREAAHKAMEARKAALVETSWCRILRAARIQCKEAEDQMYRAEKTAAEAFKVAAAMGVIMYDTPNCPQKTYKMESSSSGGGGSTTLTITASFETEFEVDKEVAAAVKIALVRLANCSSFREDDFKELLRKISQNPDCDDTHVDPSEPSSSECESVNDLELDKAARKSDFSSRNFDWKMLDLHMRHKTFEKETKIEDLMYERLRRLKEDELSSLATIVATCGLSAALAEVESGKLLHGAGSSAVQSSISALNLPRRMSSAASSNLHNGRKQLKSELPSLDKFLVKHVTKLEREVLEAKNSRSNEAKELVSSVEDEKVVSNLETMLINPPSALENEVKETECKGGEEFKTLSNKLQARKTFVSHKEVVSAVPSLDKYLVKHVSRFEKEVQEARNRRRVEKKEVQEGKENLNMLKSSLKMGWEMEDSLDKILVKPVHRLEREKMQAVLAESNYDKQRQNKKQVINNRTSDCQSLDELLVKHVSRLEEEKMRCKPENLKRREMRNEVLEFCARKAALVVTDRPYLRPWRSALDELVSSIEDEGDDGSRSTFGVVQVEGDVVVPAAVVTDKEEYAARTIRPRITKHLERYVVPLESLTLEQAFQTEGKSLWGVLDQPNQLKPLDVTNGEAVARTLELLDIDRSVKHVSWHFKGGEAAASACAKKFLTPDKLASYATERNEPSLDAGSDLSLYLRYGHICVVRVVLAANKLKSVARAKEGLASFLEELIVRRELSVNLVVYNQANYDSMRCLPNYAQVTLQEHADDKRDTLYSRDKLESFQTGDKFWNAAQRELVVTGKMHGYMRMYWGKKLLEWTRTPEEGFNAALVLNNKYALDAPDPNSYAGVAWTFGKHDQGWKERPIFGKVRFMNEAGLKRKFKMDAYVLKVGRLAAKVDGDEEPELPAEPKTGRKKAATRPTTEKSGAPAKKKKL